MLDFSSLIAFLAVWHVAGADVIASVDQMQLDENNRLASHFLLYHGSHSCKNTLRKLKASLREIHEINDELAEKFFGNSVADCSAVCLERGTHVDQITSPLPYLIHHDISDMAEWVGSTCQKAEIGFLSYAPHTCDINWIDSNGRSINIGQLDKGEKNTAWQQSYLGHTFEIVDTVTLEVLKRITVEHHAIIPIGSPHSSITVRNVDAQVRNTFRGEWDRAHRVKRTFTDFGFNRGTLPPDLWGSISAYHYNNRDNKVLEEWDSKGVFVNWWERDVYFIPMPWELKKYWQARLKELVENWSGVKLELTDIYGMRRYEDGARLLTHVDREATHAASLIINVAQGAIRKPWKVEIYDFADRLHEVEMNEGDIVYYESARCLHGRMQPLEGAFYVNLFAHYRPVGDPQWFTKPNPPDAPKPVLDLGECTTDGTAVNCSGGVQPPFLSPYLDTLKSHQDLYDFWKRVEPTDPVSKVTKSHEEL